jgi:hypothetical protein
MKRRRMQRRGAATASTAVAMAEEKDVVKDPNNKVCR